MLARYKIKFLPEFEQAFEEITDYLLEISLGTLQRFESDFKSQLSSLPEFPYLYQAYEHKLSEPLRKMTMIDFNYQAFYRVDEEKKLIIFYAILHGSQDIFGRLKRRLKALV